MYSVLLMTAMTASAPETPQFGLCRARGCSGCVGACFGCGGCYGYAWGWQRGCAGCTGCTGCTGCVGCCGGFAFGGSYRGPYAPPAGRPVGPVWVYGGDVWGANYSYSASTPFIRVSQNSPPAGQEKKNPDSNGSARLIIEVPADAKLYIDGQAMKSSTEVRHFYTPELNDGQTYFYDVRVEMMQDKKLVTEDRRVFVRANDVVRESFKKAGESASVASK